MGGDAAGVVDGVVDGAMWEAPMTPEGSQPQNPQEDHTEISGAWQQCLAEVMHFSGLLGCIGQG